MFNVAQFLVFGSLFVFLFNCLRLISYKKECDKEKISPFECGFDTSGSARLSFCMKFFLIGVLFLIFDVEVCLITPLNYRQTYIIMFIMVLMIGLLYEWYFGGLE